jgi:RNA polymerase sigma factor (TIGR02999 family)
MSDVTRLLDAAAVGDRKAAADLPPLVYDELRKLAAARMAAEAPGHTLQPTALVHEAYLRLVGAAQPQNWNSRGHFFGAASRPCAASWSRPRGARAAGATAAGGSASDLDLAAAPAPQADDDLLALDEALARMAQVDPDAARLVELRYFTGLTMPEAAAALGIPLRTAERNWAYARAWLHRAVSQSSL